MAVVTNKTDTCIKNPLSNSDVGGFTIFNAAHIDTALEVDVTSLAPAGTPRVTNNPVVDTIEGSITDDDDGVVSVHWSAAASGIGVHAGPTEMTRIRLTHGLFCSLNV